MRGCILALALVALPAAAADPCPCETPKPHTLTCDDLKAKAAKKGCQPEVKIVDHLVMTPCSLTVDTPAQNLVRDLVEVPGPERTVEKTILVPTAVPPTGHWLLGGGLDYFHGAGVHLSGGYQTKDGVQFLLSPSYIPQNEAAGYDATCRIGCNDCRVHVPGTEEVHHYGIGATVLYAFK